MSVTRKTYAADYKAKIALEAYKGDRLLNEIASSNDIHPIQVAQWKRQLLENCSSIFSDKRAKANKDQEELQDRLYQEIGQLKVELDWLKKKSANLVK